MPVGRGWRTLGRMERPYRVEELSDALTFLALTERIRAEDPFATNVIATVAAGVVQGRRYESEHWWVVRDGPGDVVGAAIRTAPHPLLLSPMPAAAARTLATVVDSPERRSLVGAPETLAAYAEGAGLLLEAVMDDVIRVLDDLVPPPAVPGEPREATEADLPLLLDWLAQFMVDAELPDLGPQSLRASVRTRLASTGYLLWVVDGVPVALASATAAVATGPGTPRVVRVGPVFTDRAHRGRGYGAAVTAEVTRRARTNADAVMLLADAANATSNGVYERLGFRLRGRSLEARLTTPPTVIADLPASGPPGT